MIDGALALAGAPYDDVRRGQLLEWKGTAASLTLRTCSTAPGLIPEPWRLHGKKGGTLDEKFATPRCSSEIKRSRQHA
jgi:hypothetical protein